MISRETIDRIFEAARIDEVVGEFVNLKKRGANLIGLCPFHNEKTPSFTVTPAKGIYKCFGCGKAGNAVGFIMDHEHYSYPEALKYLAQRYHIDIEEEARDEKSAEEKNERESLFIINAFAQKYFSELLHNHPEGKAIGYTYFIERGFTEETIKKFQLGYALPAWSAFTDEAVRNSYQPGLLVKSGLTLSREQEGGEGNTRYYDRFRGRVMFPVHNLSGRVIAFGGRVLQTDPKSPKYVNSPETEIYHKSDVLYGIFFARKAIAENDFCCLVEGYTDVISMHQAGVENVVASSGTSLTREQIRLIGRYTKNISVLYDGDPAGIKASLRGIDLILEEGLNVKVILFPDGDDPDSFARKVSHIQLREFITKNAKDFIVFKAALLLQEAANDPIRKALLIKDIVGSISKIPDGIIRAMYIRQCGAMMDVAEEVLISEMNRVRREMVKKQAPEQGLEDLLPAVIKDEPRAMESLSAEHQEREVIRLLLGYGDHEIFFEDPSSPAGETPESKMTVAGFIRSELEGEVELTFPLYAKIFREYFEERPDHAGKTHFINHPDPEISKLAVDLLANPYELSENWSRMHNISVPGEEHVLRHQAFGAVNALKLRRVQGMIEDLQKKIKTTEREGPDIENLLQEKAHLDRIKAELGKAKGTVVIR